MKLRTLHLGMTITFLTGSLASGMSPAKLIHCPTANEIKTKGFDDNGCIPGTSWCAYNHWTEKPATSEKLKQFKETVEYFSVTEWSEDHRYNSSCLYHPLNDIAISQTTTGVYGDKWKQMYDGALCEDKATACLFTTH